MWCGTVFALVQVHRSYKYVISWCHLALADTSNIQGLTILVRAINSLAKPLPQAEARATWDALYPGEVHSVRMVRNTGKLPKLVAKFDKLSKKLEQLEEKKQKLIGADSGHQAEVKSCGCCGPLTKTIAKTAQKLTDTKEQIGVARDQLCGDELDKGLSYFVVFKSARSATIAAQVTALDPTRFEVSAAPVPAASASRALAAAVSPASARKSASSRQQAPCRGSPGGAASASATASAASWAHTARPSSSAPVASSLEKYRSPLR